MENKGIGLEEDKLLNTGTLGVSVVAIIQFLQVPEFSCALWISASCFAACIPLLCMNIIVLTVENKADTVPRRTRFVDWLMIMGLGLAVFGIMSLFFHFHMYLGILFFVCSSLAGYVALRRSAKVEDSRRN